MTKTGKVSFSNGEPSLGDGTRLARCGSSDPFGAAGSFLGSQQPPIRDGDTIQVTGTDGDVDGVAAFCITAASRVTAGMALARKKAASKKKGVSSNAATAKKTAAVKKKAAPKKKAVVKKAAAKKVTSRKRLGPRK